MNNIATYFADAKKELKKIVWPDKNKLVETSLIVLGCSAVFAIYCWGMDTLIALTFDYFLYSN